MRHVVKLTNKHTNRKVSDSIRKYHLDFPILSGTFRYSLILPDIVVERGQGWNLRAWVQSSFPALRSKQNRKEPDRGLQERILQYR